MGQSSCIRKFSHYTILSVFGTFGVSCYILADTFFVSKGLGTSGLTALNLAIPIYNFIHGTGLMLGMGGTMKFSVYKGQGNPQLAMKGIRALPPMELLPIFLLSSLQFTQELHRERNRF